MRIRAKRNSLLAVIPAFSLSFVQAFAALGLLACGGDKPPAQLPSTAARDRVATRIELVDMVISDPVRAAKVRSLYMAMDSLLRRPSKYPNSHGIQREFGELRLVAKMKARDCCIRRLRTCAVAAVTRSRGKCGSSTQST